MKGRSHTMKPIWKLNILCGTRCSSKEQLFKVPMKWKIEVLKNRRIWKGFKSKEEWRFSFCHISSRSRDIQDFCIMQIRYWWRSLFCVLTSILSHLMMCGYPDAVSGRPNISLQFQRFQMVVSWSKLARLTPNLGSRCALFNL